MHDLLIILMLMLILLTLMSLLGGSIYQDQSHLAAMEKYFQGEMLSRWYASSMDFITGGGSSGSDKKNVASSADGDDAPSPAPPSAADSPLLATAAPVMSAPSSPESDSAFPAPGTCAKCAGTVGCCSCKKSASTGRVWWTAEGIEDDAAAGSSASVTGYVGSSTNKAKTRKDQKNYAMF